MHPSLTDHCPTLPLAPSPTSPSLASLQNDLLKVRDAAPLLYLMGELSSLRNDPRRWRLRLLAEITRLLPALCAASFVVKVRRGKLPIVASIFDVGFGAAERIAFVDEFNTAPFQDPLSQKALAAVAGGGACATFTAARSDLVDDATWKEAPNVRQFRREAQIDDCLLSVHRHVAVEPIDALQETLMILCAFRRWGEPPRFSVWERTILHTLHTGLGWMYHAEEATQRLMGVAVLSPRLKQTLDFLLAGYTERQVAMKMSISVHTVHDYVKALYLHFRVSSRGELVARWIRAGEKLPTRGDQSLLE